MLALTITAVLIVGPFVLWLCLAVDSSREYKRTEDARRAQRARRLTNHTAE